MFVDSAVDATEMIKVGLMQFIVQFYICIDACLVSVGTDNMAYIIGDLMEFRPYLELGQTCQSTPYMPTTSEA